MPREPKPYFRKSQNRWVVTICGTRITLGKDKAEAFQKFHELMADQQQVSSAVFTLYELSQSYLDWVQSNRKPTTYAKAKHYLQSFIASVGRMLKVALVQRQMDF
ncbi:MAG: hypothetical protein AAFP69_05190 [Planctomycetota bacterium]